jgi:hypothetical protein
MTHLKSLIIIYKCHIIIIKINWEYLRLEWGV